MQQWDYHIQLSIISSYLTLGGGGKEGRTNIFLIFSKYEK